MTDRHFTAPADEIEGTVDSVSPGGITLKEYPGRKFHFSSVGMSAADMSARIIGEHNNMTRAEAAGEVDRRRGALRQYLADNLSGQVSRLSPIHRYKLSESDHKPQISKTSHPPIPAIHQLSRPFVRNPEPDSCVKATFQDEY